MVFGLRLHSARASERKLPQRSKNESLTPPSRSPRAQLISPSQVSDDPFIVNIIEGRFITAGEAVGTLTNEIHKLSSLQSRMETALEQLRKQEASIASEMVSLMQDKRALLEKMNDSASPPSLTGPAPRDRASAGAAELGDGGEGYQRIPQDPQPEQSHQGRPQARSQDAAEEDQAVQLGPGYHEEVYVPTRTGSHRRRLESPEISRIRGGEDCWREAALERFGTRGGGGDLPRTEDGISKSLSLPPIAALPAHAPALWRARVSWNLGRSQEALQDAGQPQKAPKPPRPLRTGGRQAPCHPRHHHPRRPAQHLRLLAPENKVRQARAYLRALPGPPLTCLGVSDGLRPRQYPGESRHCRDGENTKGAEEERGCLWEYQRC